MTPPLDERPVVQVYSDAETCEHARAEQLSVALRVAKATDADPEAEVTAQAWQRTLAVDARPLRARTVKPGGLASGSAREAARQGQERATCAGAAGPKA